MCIRDSSNTGLANETWANGNANYAGNPAFAMRTGALATASSNRTSSGGTFYGIMEMSGNLFELVITAGNDAGRSFDGKNGDGILTATAESNTPNWPSVTNNLAMVVRGGNLFSGIAELQICDRSNGFLDYSSNYGNRGGRATRTAE